MILVVTLDEGSVSESSRPKASLIVEVGRVWPHLSQ